MEKSAKFAAPFAEDENRSSTKTRGWCSSFACLHCHVVLQDLILCNEVVRSLHARLCFVSCSRVLFFIALHAFMKAYVP